jgi:hypothetical protein
MKYISFSLILFILFSVYLCAQTSNTDDKKEDPSIQLSEIEEKYGKNMSTLEDSPEELEKRRKENEKKFKELIQEILKELGLENTSKITREEFKKIFEKILEKDKTDKDKDRAEKKKGDLSLLTGFAEQIFDNIVSKDQEYIDVDKIMDYFQPKNILNALKVALKAVGLDSLVDALEGPLTEALESSLFSDDNGDQNKTKTEEKNADL